MKACAFTIYDEANRKFADGLRNSLRKYHSAKDLPLIEVDPAWLNRIRDEHKFYRMTPFIARQLIGEYDTVIKIDADTIITGDISHLWKAAEYDVGCVLNSNPKEPQFAVWDIPAPQYLNCGLVAMRSKEFIDHWWKLCISDKFLHYQFREQDLLNILYYYGNYTVLNFDASPNWHGLIAKGWWPYVTLKGEELVLPKGDRPWPIDGDKIIKAIHFAGGNDPQKGNYRLHFSAEVCQKLDNLIK